MYIIKHHYNRLEPSKGSYRKEWVEWEKRLRVVLSANADYLNSIQVSRFSAFCSFLSKNIIIIHDVLLSFKSQLANLCRTIRFSNFMHLSIRASFKEATVIDFGFGSLFCG